MSTAPFPKPPPLPPKPPSNQSQRKIRVPPAYFPKAESLLYLLQPDSQRELSSDEFKRIQASEIGDEVLGILNQCKGYRSKLHNSQQRLEDSPGSRKRKQQYTQDLLTYQACLTSVACPARMQQFMSCWSNISPEVLTEFHGQGMASWLCRSERQAVERCVGELVSRAVRTGVDDFDGRDGGDGFGDDEIDSLV